LKVAALYDIHGNLPALEAVLQEIESLDIDQIVVGGDVVLGPMSRDCLDRLMAIGIPIHFIHGNCEISVLAQMSNSLKETFPERVAEDIRWTAGQLQTRHQKFISKWPETIALEIDGLGKILFCHATPRNATEIFTRLTADHILLPVFEEADASIVICGHTHMQFDRRLDKVRIINAGSVGMPFGKPGAYWLLLDSDVELRHTAYDLVKAANQIRRTNYPYANDFADNNVLQPPTEAHMLEVFSRSELK